MEDASLSGTELTALLEGLDPVLRKWLTEGALPCVELVLQEGAVQGSTSWVGGSPELTQEQEWPHYTRADGTEVSLQFFAQVALGGAGDLGLGLPGNGTLAFFADLDFESEHAAIESYAHPLGSRCLWVPDGASRRSAPAGVEVHEERALTQVRSTSLGVDQLWLLEEFSHLTSSDDDEEVVEAVEKRYLERVLASAGKGHVPTVLGRLGGHSSPVQSLLEEDFEGAVPPVVPEGRYCAYPFKPLEFLFELRSDLEGGTDLVWADAGTMYWLAHRDALMAQDYAAVRYSFQGC